MNPKLRLIGGYLEGVKDGSKLRRSCQAAAEAGKPLLILKAGCLARGGSGKFAPTPGPWPVPKRPTRPFFAQEGVFAVETLTEMLSLFKAFAPGRLPRGNRAAVMSLSGGMGFWRPISVPRPGLSWLSFLPGRYAHCNS